MVITTPTKDLMVYQASVTQLQGPSWEEQQKPAFLIKVGLADS